MARRVVLLSLFVLLLVLPFVLSQTYDVKIDTEFKDTVVKKVNTGNVERVVGPGFTKEGNVYLVNGFDGQKRQIVFESGGGYKSYSVKIPSSGISGGGREDFGSVKYEVGLYQDYGGQPIIEVVELSGVGSITTDLNNPLETTIDFDSGEKPNNKIFIYLTTNNTAGLVNLDFYYFPDDLRRNSKFILTSNEDKIFMKAKIFMVKIPAGGSVAYLGKDESGKNRVLVVNEDERKSVSFCPGISVPDCYYLTDEDLVWAYQIKGNRNDVVYAQFPWLSYYQFDTIRWPLSLRFGRATEASPTQHVVIKDSSHFTILEDQVVLEPDRGTVQTFFSAPAGGTGQNLDKSFEQVIRRGINSPVVVKNLVTARTLGAIKKKRDVPLIFPVGLKNIPGFVLENPYYSAIFSNTEFAGANPRLVKWFLNRMGAKGSKKNIDYKYVTEKLEGRVQITSMYRSKSGLNQLQTDGNKLLIPTVINTKSSLTIIYNTKDSDRRDVERPRGYLEENRYDY